MFTPLGKFIKKRAGKYLKVQKKKPPLNKKESNKKDRATH